MLGIVVSAADSASEHVGDRLLSLADWTALTDAHRPAADGGGTYYRLDAADVEDGVDAEDAADADVEGATAGDATARDGGGNAPVAELRTFEAMHVDLEDVADAFAAAPDLVAFVSRHAGETGPLLTAHFTGNLGPAEYGGREGDLARAAPHALAAVVDRLAAHAPDGYEVGIEGTHHGPTAVGAPSMFVEVGSDEPQWADPEAAGAVARAVLDLAVRGVAPDRLADGRGGRVAGRAGGEGEGGDAPRADGDGDSTPTPTPTPSPARHLAGFGGGHYAPRYLRVVRETDWAVGHVGVDWQLDAMPAPDEPAGRAVIERVLDASAADYALVEGARPAVREAVAAAGARVVGETWVRETAGVPAARATALEAALSTVDEGLRFGEPARTLGGAGRDGVEGESESGSDADAEAAATDSDDWRVVPLPDDLLAAALGVDDDATRAAVEARLVAFETDHGGTEPAGRAAAADATALDALVDDLVGILRERYASVEREVADGREAVVARDRGFDPERARTLGVPEGPAFGRLADGEAVEVNGRHIDPDAVRTEQVERFPVPAPDPCRADPDPDPDPDGGGDVDDA